MSDIKFNNPNPEQWLELSLSDTCDFISRGTAPVYVENSSILAIGQRCVTANGFDANKSRFHSESAENGVLLANSGDVLVNSTGTGTIGRSCIFDAHGSYMVDGHITVLRPLKNLLDSRWLNSLVRSSWGQNHLERYCYSGSTNQVELNKKSLHTIKIPVPPILEQKAFGSILDTLENTIRQTEAIIEKLKQVKQGLLHDLLTRGIDANGELRPPQSEAPELYKESVLGWIPREWKIRTLDNISDVARGKFTHRPRNDPAFFGGKHPFIQTGDVANNVGGYVSEYSQVLSERGITVSQEFPAGTIAITIAANIADTAILAIPMYFPDSVVGVVVAPEINVRFIELTIRRAKAKLDARAPQSAQKNINLQDLRPLPIALPCKFEQDNIAEKYESIRLRIDAEKNTLDKLRHQKAGLMDDLLTGRVRVTPLLESATA